MNDFKILSEILSSQLMLAQLAWNCSVNSERVFKKTLKNPVSSAHLTVVHVSSEYMNINEYDLKISLRNHVSLADVSQLDNISSENNEHV